MYFNLFYAQASSDVTGENHFFKVLRIKKVNSILRRTVMPLVNGISFGN